MLIGAGAAVALAGAATVPAAFASSAAAGGVVAAAIVVPILAVGGVMRGMNSRKVNKEIQSRQTLLPIVLQVEEEKSVDVFFPLSPSPRQIELTYVDSLGDHTLIIDTHAALDGLHLVPADK
jgi:hypothetical protein